MKSYLLEKLSQRLKENLEGLWFCLAHVLKLSSVRFCQVFQPQIDKRNQAKQARLDV